MTRLYVGPPANPFEPGHELWEMTVSGPDCDQFEVGVAEPGRPCWQGFEVISDLIEVLTEWTVDHMSLYYGGRLVGSAKFPRGPIAMIPGDNITFCHRIDLPGVLSGRFATSEQLVLEYFSLLDAHGRGVWRQVFDAC